MTKLEELMLLEMHAFDCLRLPEEEIAGLRDQWVAGMNGVTPENYLMLRAEISDLLAVDAHATGRLADSKTLMLRAHFMRRAARGEDVYGELIRLSAESSGFEDQTGPRGYTALRANALESQAWLPGNPLADVQYQKAVILRGFLLDAGHPCGI